MGSNPIPRTKVGIVMEEETEDFSVYGTKFEGCPHCHWGNELDLQDQIDGTKKCHNCGKVFELHCDLP